MEPRPLAAVAAAAEGLTGHAALAGVALARSLTQSPARLVTKHPMDDGRFDFWDKE